MIRFHVWLLRYSVLTLLLALAVSHPTVKQFEDGFLHSLRRIRAWEVFSDFIHRERQIPVLRLFLLQHDTEYGIVVELAFAR